jgi:hypothetical protein
VFAWLRDRPVVSNVKHEFLYGNQSRFQH